MGKGKSMSCLLNTISDFLFRILYVITTPFPNGLLKLRVIRQLIGHEPG